MEENVTETTETTQTAEEVIDTALNDAVADTIGGGDNEELPAAQTETQPAEPPKPDNAAEPPNPGSTTAPETQPISPNQEPAGDAGEPVDEVGEALDAMDADGGYDPGLMKLLKGLVAENRKLKSAGASAEQATFFDKQFGSLDEGVRSLVDAAHKSQLKAKFDILSAGYKAAKAKVSREDVFKEAAKLALGDLMAKAAETRKNSALAQRRNLALARPGGEIGHRRHNGPVTEADIANEIWDQINS